MFFLRHPGNDSSSDSEGEEAPYEGGVEEKDDEDVFKRVVQQQREMQIKRAKEAESKKQKT
jgi:hypothetical protein